MSTIKGMHPSHVFQNPRYFARKRMLIGDSWREYGEEVPEAANWINAQAYVNHGYLEVMEDADFRTQVAAGVAEGPELAARRGRPRKTAMGSLFEEEA